MIALGLAKPLDDDGAAQRELLQVVQRLQWTPLRE